MAEEVIGLLFGVDGGGSIDGRSGKRIVKDLSQIVKQINSGKSTVPRVQLQFDTSHAKKSLLELKTQLQEIANMGNISVSGMPSRNGSGNASANTKKNDSTNTKQEAENYRNLTAAVKQYYAALTEIEKIELKSNAVSSSDGVWSTSDSQYDARIAKVNQLKAAFDALGVTVTTAGTIEMRSAKELNITEQQRSLLLAQIQSAITSNGLAHEKSASQITATWDKNAAKVHEYILRIQDVASKNAEVNALMTELNALASSGNPKNLDELTAKFATLQQKIRETNADVETFGQKLTKSFGAQLRAMLASMVYMKVLQFIRDIYNNVVELDKAMTDLQIASGKTREEIKELTKGYADLAKQLGATTAEVAEAADTWLRQGYSIEEANTLIKNSTMLSKLGQIEAAEASTALTSAMKGYKVSVEDSVGIVDKLTAVDMEAAASAGGIATAMAETATSADIAGVSMDRLIGYIATVKEVTQDGAESVGKRIAQQYSNVLQVGNNIGQRPEVAETEVILCFTTKNVAA